MNIIDEKANIYNQNPQEKITILQNGKYEEITIEDYINAVEKTFPQEI